MEDKRKMESLIPDNEACYVALAFIRGEKSRMGFTGEVIFKTFTKISMTQSPLDVYDAMY